LWLDSCCFPIVQSSSRSAQRLRHTRVPAAPTDAIDGTDASPVICRLWRFRQWPQRLATDQREETVASVACVSCAGCVRIVCCVCAQSLCYDPLRHSLALRSSLRQRPPAREAIAFPGFSLSDSAPPKPMREVALGLA
jgi:hypothetical protein